MIGVAFAHPTVLSLVAFLLRVIASIEYSAIYIIYEHQSTLESDAIAKALHSQLQTYKTIRKLGPAKSFEMQVINGTIFQNGALFISLANEDRILQMIGENSDTYLNSGILAYLRMKFICLIMNASEEVKYPKQKKLNMFHVVLRNDGGLDFLMWPTFRKGQVYDVALKRLTNEAALFSSIEWQKFSNRVDRRFLKGIKVDVVLKSTSSINLEAVRHTNGQFYSGILVGISRVIFDCFAVKEVNMVEIFTGRSSSFIKEKVVPRDVAFLDQRQTWPLAKKSFYTQYMFVIGGPSFGDWMPSMSDVYMVLAPHQLVPPEVTWTLFWERTLLLVMILGTTLGMLVIRLFCRRMEPAGQTNRNALFFDTFARSLGTSAGNWLGQSSSERQLLVVLSTFAILMGGVFSGVLYERSLHKEDKERFNTLQEICAAGINVTIDMAVLYSLFLVVGESPYLGHLKKCIEKRGVDMNNLKSRNSYVTSQHAGYRTDQHHILAEPFIELPTPLYIEPFYMLRPFLLIARQCVEHGLIQAFRSVATHSKQLELASKYNEQDYSLQQKRMAGENTYFEFKLLVVGLAVASCVFVGELVSVAKWP